MFTEKRKNCVIKNQKFSILIVVIDFVTVPPPPVPVPVGFIKGMTEATFDGPLPFNLVSCLIQSTA